MEQRYMFVHTLEEAEYNTVVRSPVQLLPKGVGEMTGS